MTKENYKQILEEAKGELARAVQQRDRLNLEIVRLQNLVNTLAFHSSASTDPMAEWKIYTELVQAVEALVNTSPSPVTPVQVRDGLVSYGYNLSHYSNPMAMIHQTLRRLASDNRIRESSDGIYTRTALYDALLKAKK